MASQAEDILNNVVRLISRLDDDELKKKQNLPFLEIAKMILESGSVFSSDCTHSSVDLIAKTQDDIKYVE